MEQLFDFGFSDFDFIAEAIDSVSRRREETDVWELNEIFRQLGVSDRVELNPEDMKFEDKHGVDGMFVGGRLDGMNFDLKHHDSMANTDLVAAQVAGYDWEINGHPGWVFHDMTEYVIWWAGKSRYAIFKMADLRNIVVRRLMALGLNPRRIADNDRVYLRQIRGVGSDRKVSGELELVRRLGKDPKKNSSQLNLYVSFSEIPGLLVIQPPSMEEKLRRAREERERRLASQRQAESEWGRRMAADEERARSLLADIKKMLSEDWNDFSTGYFRWSPSLKTIVYYKPSSHRIEEFPIGNLGSHNETFRELLAKLKELVGTLTKTSLPSSMEQLRRTADILGKPRDMDFDRYMRALAARAGTSPQKWDWVKENGILKSDVKNFRPHRMMTS